MSLGSKLFLLFQPLPPTPGILSIIGRPKILNTIFMPLITTLADFTHRVIEILALSFGYKLPDINIKNQDPDGPHGQLPLDRSHFT